MKNQGVIVMDDTLLQGTDAPVCQLTYHPQDCQLLETQIQDVLEGMPKLV